MITLLQYVGPHSKSKDWNAARQANAAQLLVATNALMKAAETAGVMFLTNPRTNSQISGATFGGFRPQGTTIGAPNSHHKEGRGIDLYDPENKIDTWCMANLAALVKAGIWIEHPSATNTWSHWQSVAPSSGKRVYYP